MWRNIAGTTTDPALHNPFVLAYAHLELARGDPGAAIAALAELRPQANAARLPLALHLREANAQDASPWVGEAAIAMANCLLDLGDRGRTGPASQASALSGFPAVYPAGCRLSGRL
jgi:hypothetical protein